MDALNVFQYLTDTNNETDSVVLMTHDQFMRIKTEHSKRKVDPFELQVFQEQLSENLKVQEDEKRLNQ
jgi:hypothetical protein